MNSSNYDTPQRNKLISLLSLHLSEHQFDGFQFRSSGTEAVEAALRYFLHTFPEGRIISFSGCYHGLTLGSQFLMGIGNPPKNYSLLPFPDEDATEEILAEIQDGVSEPTIVFIEPVQGANLRAPSPRFLAGVAELRDKHQSFYLVADSMLASIRCGSLTGFKAHLPLDFFVAGKSWANGYPFSMVALSRRARNSLGDLIGTTSYGGNAVSCLMASNTIEKIYSDFIFEHIAKRELQIHECFNDWPIATRPLRTEAHGLLFGIDLESAAAAKAFAKAMLRCGILVARIGTIIRLSPPLNIGEGELACALGALQKCASEL